MSKYTTELRYICENYAGLDASAGYNDEADIIEKARTKLFDFDFPIYDEAYRSVLETKIIKHYYFNEIGFETVGMFKHYLNARLNEIMPLYNKLYNSELLEFNPLYDVDLTTEHTRDTGGNSEASGSTTSKEQNDYTRNLADDNTRSDKYTRNLSDSENSTRTANDWTYNNDTPQGGISGLENLDYLTSATRQSDNESSETNRSATGSDERTTTDTGTQTGTENRTIDGSGTSSATNTYKDTETYLEHVSGKTGGASYSVRLKEYRDTFLNIDRDIIDALSDLFMLLW